MLTLDEVRTDLRRFKNFNPPKISQIGLERLDKIVEVLNLPRSFVINLVIHRFYQSPDVSMHLKNKKEDEKSAMKK